MEDELNSIIAALGGDVEEKNVRQCPGCKEVYAEKIGCTQVRCPNLQCNTWFCWKCGKDDITWMHMIGKCNPGYDDLLKALYPVKFFLDIGLCMTLFITPSMFLILYVFGPLAVAIATPAYFIHRMRNLLYTNSLWLKIFIFIALLPVGCALAIFALLPITLIWLFYLAFFFMKTIPIFGTIFILFEFADTISSCFGYGGWFEAYKHAEEKKRTERARNRMHRREQRKRRIRTP